jgi:hypothetical protein
LIQAVRDLGARHAEIVPKHTSRKRRVGDEGEMICSDDEGYRPKSCDVVYKSHGDRYGVVTGDIWAGFTAGRSQIIVVSQVNGINALRRAFGELIVLVYVHSELTREEYISREQGRASVGEAYASKRAADYRNAFQVYVENILAFDHVLIASAIKEDLFDQLFRLFYAYEAGRV